LRNHLLNFIEKHPRPLADKLVELRKARKVRRSVVLRSERVDVEFLLQRPLANDFAVNGFSSSAERFA
jgi:hypothetical protein